MKPREVAYIEIPGQCGIAWVQTGKHSHQVTYGLQVDRFHGELADVEAAEAFGHAVRHAAECAGRLDC